LRHRSPDYLKFIVTSDKGGWYSMTRLGAQLHIHCLG